MARRTIGLFATVCLIGMQATTFAAPAQDDRHAVSDLPVVYLDQNWEPKDSIEFYALRQGSPIVREDLYLNLEQPDSQEMFTDAKYAARFGFLPQERHTGNPKGYPVGFVSGRGALEVNCAACHTSRLVYGGKEYRIDGSQAMTDMDGWLAELNRALQLTIADAPSQAEWDAMEPDDSLQLDSATKFGRFARRILGASQPKASQAYAVLTTLKSNAARRQRYKDFNDFGQLPANDAERATLPKRPAYGFGRIDALGAILNQATAEALDIPANARVANAPVNYPMIWDAPQHERVQWNGSVENAGFGALGRNTGQVIGVFGLVKCQESALGGYDSSINFDALEKAEELITKLWSPQWPEEFGQIDGALQTRGKVLYEQNCVSCHAIIKRDDPNRKASEELVYFRPTTSNPQGLKTDPLAASNWSLRRAEIGVLAGRYRSYPLGERFNNDPNDSEYAREILKNLVFNVLTRSYVPWREELTLDDAEEPQFVFTWGAVGEDLLRYKARPLNGVWSTSPYLHNGSVLDMVELLKPSVARKKTFRVGTNNYDPKTLGYTDDGPFEFDTTVEGNHNTGHEYGGDLPDDDKAALIEYLKRL